MMLRVHSLLVLVLLACQSLRGALSFSLPRTSPASVGDRRQVLQRSGAVLASVLLVGPQAVMAKDESKKGTKEDKGFQACLSKCLFECTKPPSTSSRAECYPECKQKCATSDAQLLRGRPKAQE
mmetsp:Transcript_7684/g.28895  ORF Transcript_7684/g.28895 Transcript_7684/m.28895 type:complete len:124 (-) Transcript_7684:433-804(-)